MPRNCALKNKKKLVVPISEGKRGDLGFEEFAQNMVEEMQKHILDESLKDWVVSDFSTTTTTDKVVASVAFVGAMSKYFDFSGRAGCGLPSVNLLGAKNDWETILQKLEKIPELGEEPKKKTLVQTVRSRPQTVCTNVRPAIKQRYEGFLGNDIASSSWRLRTPGSLLGLVECVLVFGMTKANACLTKEANGILQYLESLVMKLI